MRARSLARLPLLATFAFVIVFTVFHRATLSTLSTPGQSRTAGLLTKGHSQLIEKSVLLRYGDTDPFTIFSAYGYEEEIIIILASYGYFMRRVFCRSFDEHMKEILPARRSLVFPEYTVHCDSDHNVRFVALSLNANDRVQAQDMRSLKLDHKGNEMFLSVCLAPLWGNTPKWLMLVEFVEYYKLQGAEHFYVYKLSTDNFTQTILDSYVNDGVVSVIDVDETTNCLRRHRCRHEMQLQDCVFRNRGRSTWVATVDLDERISIIDGGTIRTYLESVQSVSSTAELRFRCRWVLRNKDDDWNPIQWRLDGSPIPMSRWHNTSHVAPLNHTTKSIIQPFMVESMGVHQVLRFLPGTDVLLVPPDNAVVRHYRSTEGWMFFLREVESFGCFEITHIEASLLENVQRNVVSKMNQLFPVGDTTQGEQHHKYVSQYFFV